MPKKARKIDCFKYKFRTIVTCIIKTYVVFDIFVI